LISSAKPFAHRVCAREPNNPQPLSSAPAFDDPPVILVITSGTASAKINAQTLSSTNVTSSGTIVNSDLKTTSGKKTGSVINVSSTEQLLSLLDAAAPGPGGKITIPASKTTSTSRNSSGINAAGRLNAGRRAADIRDTHPLLAARLR